VGESADRTSRMRDGPQVSAGVNDGSLDVVPTFLCPQGGLTWDFAEALTEVKGSPHLDSLAIASMLSFQYVIDGHTLVAQVKRRPWLDAVGPPSDEGFRATLGGYGHRVMTTRAAASELLARLRLELREAFADSERVTLLLSGGLDSRLTSAVLVGLARRGHITNEIRAVTWGMPESRDRHYGRRVAEHLGVPWVPFGLGPQDLEENIRIAAHELGGLVSPVHLHAMNSIRQLDWSAGDKILVSSMGNGVGRGLYLNHHLSYARHAEPCDWLGLMRPVLYSRIKPHLVEQRAAFRRLLQPYSQIAVYECEMQAHYISGLLLPPFNLLRRTGAQVYQALTDRFT
jgi:Asparagine synthase